MYDSCRLKSVTPRISCGLHLASFCVAFSSFVLSSCSLLLLQSVRSANIKNMTLIYNAHDCLRNITTIVNFRYLA
jgi:hypothetical protein